ncbi:polysaccharide pyruvyl transferase family protein [Paracoccus sp. AS002]|uniref:polysaccharide pyruvyl transferase family protein n=1 Tax=Paracoccus sp. AS002 TaxID=3019545 RepID=UPI0023E8900A|nr:polysaccharide pyruvyl transferase family protein [Paracoccus sp. AS002]MDF3904332.1 polysaccharide pyruvyl transferase family protein [Paracoccus sp. AS002]
MTTALVHFNHSFKDDLTTWPDMRISRWKPNYGDMLVCAALLRQVDLGETVRLSFGMTLERPVSRALVRGSTYLHHKFDFEAANRTLDSIDAPITIVGLGAQSPESKIDFLNGNEGARSFIARLNERSASISVRGQFTAAVVERLGGKNIRVTGCPSLFYTLKCPVVSPSPDLNSKRRRFGVSLHTGLRKSMYCASPDEARQAHVNAIRYGIDECSALYLFEQGVMNEFNIADKKLPIEERIAAAREVIDRIGAADQLSADDLIKHMVSVRSIEEWLARASELDAIIGFRFHGNMVALLQGKPCYYYVYDSRIREFCDLYQLPYQDVREDWRDPGSALLDHDWDQTNMALKACYREMQEFFHENGFQSQVEIAA